ncbi:helix-turn-helix transcriptional regulator [Diaphorobacter aerolatus]|uniref:Helix-turn-helix transcriptional regulator n=1 Tax=Diaphorobacter aerolatus TaxID=1288495 RepID=A0A7H0GHV9_9BURK|nr:helix-turn-helix transcriptional regulator [Diaphorobacter aerolatus]QNP47875.1 helix-turn-helix transcriptional regulator [Diaphorobacter aerolatus]
MPRQNTSPSDYPLAVLQQIERLAQNIVIARKRRGETQGQWARRLGVSQPTMARIERGDPSVAMASYVMCMWLINQAEGLADLVAPEKDHAALEREVQKVAGSAVRSGVSRKPWPVVRESRQPSRVSEPQPRPPAGSGNAAAVAAGLAALVNSDAKPHAGDSEK